MRRRDFMLTTLALCANHVAARGREDSTRKKKSVTVASNYEISNVVEAQRVSGGGVPAVADFDHAAWNKARAAHIARYWSGEEAPVGRRAEARILWDDASLGVRFSCRQEEPLVVSASPRLEQKTLGLWDRDVCEFFIAPDVSEIEHYYEFEAAPTGEWIDLAIRVRPQGRETDWHFRSGMQAAARVSEGALTIAMRVPWKALGRTPRAGERWRINLFRCVGAGATRGYLAWQPTHTPEPGFHVPQKFGWIKFK
ncbi:MAG: carbohydrate-binding family 9-like protein [Acidobacteria bacterium]|nr:carbohydrate-binding family 9-like protein [Acidobacteriota bacterium]